MRSLVIYCHPCPDSFASAMRDAVTETLQSAGHEVRVTDLYANNFNPLINENEWRNYAVAVVNEEPVQDYIDDIRWCDTLVFVYPTWWYGLPAMLKGWLDRVWVPHVTFSMPTESEPIRPLMQHIDRIAVVTSCGAPWLLSKFIGEPGRKTVLRGIRALCGRNCKTLYLAHYKMDTASRESLTKYLLKIRRKLKRFAS